MDAMSDEIEQNAEPLADENENESAAVIDVIDDKNKEGEIDKLYAELDGIDVDFEINKLEANENKNEAIANKADLEIVIDESANNEMMEDVQISPMESSKN